MDVLRLDATTYLPDALIEDYNSMIWTERYFTDGEFSLKTGNVAVTRALLPEGQPISLLDSREVMTVENHSISVDADNIPELTISGRSFETCLEDRTLTGTYNTPWTTLQAYTTAELISLLLWMSFVNTSGQDPTKVATTIDTGTAVANVSVTDSTTVIDASTVWSLENGPLYQVLLDFLNLGGLGLRTIRPPGTTGNVVYFDTSSAPSRGWPNKTATAVSGLRLDVYNGLDRRRQQSAREPVIFHYASGHIDSPKYLFSIKDLKNLVRVVADIGSFDVVDASVDGATLVGLNKRILYMNGGAQGTQDIGDFVNALTQKALVELQKYNRKVIFDGAISPISPYHYNEHYELGDKVTLMAEYGIEASMMVAEYVRTEDQNGDRGYPTLVLAT